MGEKGCDCYSDYDESTGVSATCAALTVGNTECAPLTEDDVSSSCDPIVLNEHLDNMGIKYYYYPDPHGYASDDTSAEAEQARAFEASFTYPPETPLVASDVATPCGLIAKSLFNDTFALYTDAAQTDRVPIKEKGIAWDSDIQYKFGNFPTWTQN